MNDKDKEQDGRPEEENGESGNINPEDKKDESEQEQTGGAKETPSEQEGSEGKKKSSEEPESEPSSESEEEEKPIETSPDSVESQDESEPEDSEEEDYGEEYYDGISQEYGYTPSEPGNVDSTEEDEAAGAPEPEKGRKEKKKELDEKKMPFLEHLEELRWTLMRSLLSIFVAAVICFIFSKQIVDFLRWPGPEDLKLIYLSPTEGFMIYIKVALFSGLVVALPYVSYEFWRFVVPGLLEKERKLVPPIVFFTVFCFALGGAFAYMLIIPFAMKFLLGFQTEYLEATIAIGKYLGFVVTLILVFGIVFELPVLSFFLSKIGLITPEFLRSKRRYGIVTIFILAAFVTPPDIMTQLMLAGPLIILYEVSVWVSAAVVRKKIEQEESEEE